MQIAKYTKEARALYNDDPMLLIYKIYDCFNTWSKNPPNKVTARDRFFIGLRYSEFLIDEDATHSEHNCYMAERQRISILTTIGVNPNFIREKLFELYGLA